MRFEFERRCVEITSFAEKLCVSIGVFNNSGHICLGVDDSHLTLDWVLVSVEHEMLVGEHVERDAGDVEADQTILN